VLPLMPGVPERRTHDYVRNGTTNLYAALDVASGQVIADMTPRHRAEEFRRFLNLIDSSVPPHLDVHVVRANSSTHKTPSIQRWLLRQPRFTLHFTPTYSSWLNLVERWFAELTTKWIKRSAHRSVRDLVASIRTWITNLERRPQALRLAQNRRRDPQQPRQLLPANQRLRSLARHPDCLLQLPFR
jgi:transposase